MNASGGTGDAGGEPLGALGRALIAALVQQRAAAGLSRAQMANRTGLSRFAISRLESGRHDVQMSVLVRYAEALGLTLGFAGTAPGAVQAGAGRRAPVTGEPDPVLSRTQRRVLQAAIDAIALQGYPPSMREIGEAVGLSTSSVEYQLSELERKGYVRRRLGRSRALEVLNPVPPLPGDRVGGGAGPPGAVLAPPVPGPRAGAQPTASRGGRGPRGAFPGLPYSMPRWRRSGMGTPSMAWTSMSRALTMVPACPCCGSGACTPLKRRPVALSTFTS